MMAITHAAIALAGTSLLFSTADPLPLALAVVGSQLPDLDTTTSVIGQILFPVSDWIEDRYPHRTITHSLVATVAIAALSFLGGIVLGDMWMLMALPLGHLLSSFSDTFTRQGVQIFWPMPVWAVSVSNPNRRLTTGGTGEYWVLVIAIALLILGYNLAGGGGITTAVGEGLGLRDSAIATYNQNAATNVIYADVKGVWASDRTRADGRYEVLAAAGSEFLVTDGTGVYKTGQQIIVDKLTTAVGPTMTVINQSVRISDEPVPPRLEELRVAYPDGEIYLSGSVAVDFPEDVRIPIDPKSYGTVAIAGDVVTFEYHPLDKAVLLLREQYAVGTLQARVVR